MHQVEDEYHLLLLYPSYIDLRRSCIAIHYWTSYIYGHHQYTHFNC